MEAEVFSNLVRVTPGLWELFQIPGVRLATSWYTSDRAEHMQITGPVSGEHGVDRVRRQFLAVR